MRVLIVGTGHVGLVTAATLAEIGHDVVGVDSDEEKIGHLRKATAPFFEPGLQELLERTTAAGSLRFETAAGEAARDAEVVFICVGTPARANGDANLLAVELAARDIAPFLSPTCVVVEKSTVPAGTAQRLRQALMRERPDLQGEIEVVSNPEFLREGQAIEDSLRPSRILIGASSKRGFETMRRLYQPLIANGTPIVEADITAAELAKHACNAFLALKISYANALARLCERAGADVTTVADAMGSDPRIGRSFLDAGLGYGGYCFPKDVQAFERLADQLGYDFPLLREITRINDQAIDATVAQVRDALWNLDDKRIALLGLSFKPGTDDVRFSPTLALARKLIEAGASVVGYDPQAGPNAKTEVPDMEVATTLEDAVDGAHCVVVCTAWDEFLSLDLERLKKLLAFPILVDARNLYDPAEITAAGFEYRGLGRPRTGSSA